MSAIESPLARPRTMPLGELLRPLEAADFSQRRGERVASHTLAAFAQGRPQELPGDGVVGAVQSVQPGDVLMSRAASEPRRAWVVTRVGGEAIASHEWLVVRSSVHDPGYLRHVLVSNEFRLHFMRALGGARLASPKLARLRAIAVPVPELARQRAIAQALDRAEALRAVRRRALDAHTGLAAALYESTIGPQSGASVHAAHVPLERLLVERPENGIDDPLRRDGTWWVLRRTDIDAAVQASEASRYAMLPAQDEGRLHLADGDLLLALSAPAYERIGDCALAFPGTSRWTWQTGLVRLRFDRTRIDPEVARAHFMSPRGRDRLASAARRRGNRWTLNIERLAGIDLPLPSLDAQRVFVERLHAAHRLGVRMDGSRQHLDGLLGVLRDRAFRDERVL